MLFEHSNTTHSLKVVDEVEVAVFALAVPQVRVGDLLGNEHLEEIELKRGVLVELEGLGRGVGPALLSEGRRIQVGILHAHYHVEDRNLGEVHVLQPGDLELTDLQVVSGLEHGEEGVLVSGESGGVGVLELHAKWGDLEGGEGELDLSLDVREELNAEVGLDV